MHLNPRRYEEIKRIVSEVVEDYDIKTLPVDVFELAKRMNILVKYKSEILKKHIDEVDESYIYAKPNGAVIYDEERKRFVVLIDDVDTGKNRQRFSLAHEIGHICLSHTDQSDEYETEADYFAHELLIATSLVVDIPEDFLLCNILSKVFCVSEETADIAIRYSEKRKCMSVNRQYEKVIRNYLLDSLKEKLAEIKKGN